MSSLSWHEAYPSLRSAHPDAFAWEEWRALLCDAMKFPSCRAWQFGEPAELFSAYADAVFSQVACEAPAGVPADALHLAEALPGTLPPAVRWYTLRYALRQVNKRTCPPAFAHVTLPLLPRRTHQPPVFCDAIVDRVAALLCHEAAGPVLRAVRAVVRHDRAVKFRVVLPREIEIDALRAAVTEASHALADVQAVSVTAAPHVSEEAHELCAHITPNE